MDTGFREFVVSYFGSMRGLPWYEDVNFFYNQHSVFIFQDFETHLWCAEILHSVSVEDNDNCYLKGFTTFDDVADEVWKWLHENA